jgi:prepilin-type N-terminal cleavage/methylation domain-containing protein
VYKMGKLKFKIGGKGYTLGEVLVSLAIFGVVGVTFMSALGTNFKVLLMADQRTTSETLAKSQLEAINNSPYDFTTPYEYDKITGIPSGYDINIAVSLVNPETGAVSALDLGVQKVAVTVTFQQNAVLVVESYKK